MSWQKEKVRGADRRKWLSDLAEGKGKGSWQKEKVREADRRKMLGELAKKGLISWQKKDR